MQEGSDNGSANIAENMYVRVVGSVRVRDDRRNVMVFKISQLESGDAQAEVEAHALECVHARLKIKQYRAKENASIGANVGGGGATNGAALSNSMMGGFAGSESTGFWN